MSDNPSPNQTLYINNLNDKLRKVEMKRLIYYLFTSFGLIHEINLPNNMRGQAFVIFDSIHAATSAMLELHNFILCEKPMHISYARTKSDAIARLDGSYQIQKKHSRQVRKMEERLERIKRENALKVICIEIVGFPDNVEVEVLTQIFKDVRGFIRAVSAEKTVVEFDALENAQNGLKMQGFPITSDYLLQLSIVI